MSVFLRACLWTVTLVTGASSVGWSQSCRPADGNSANMIGSITATVAATDPDEAARRAGLKLPATTASNVVLVTDQRTCDRALSAYIAALPVAVSPAPTSVYVVQVTASSGTVFVVMAPIESAESEFQSYVVLDSRYKVLERYGA